MYQKQHSTISVCILNCDTVPDLPVCVDQRDAPQCCSTQFIQEQQSLAEQNFIQGLRTDLTERFQQFDSIVDQLRTCEYI